MHVCQRCVSLLLSRPLSAALQHSTRALHQRSHLTLLQHSTRHTLSQRHSRQTWRHFADHQAASPDVYNKIDLAQKQVVPLNSEVHRIDLDAAVHTSPLQEISEEEAVQIQVPSALPPESSTLRPYVDKSETLSKLVQLEQRPNVGSMLVRLDFHADVAPRLLFLKDLGVEESKLGQLLTKNPFILTESLDNLEARVSYLKSKKFSKQSVAAMVSKAPYLLNFSVERLDNRLGFFQKQLGLSAEKTRDIVTRLPKLLCGSLEPIKENLKVCELEFGFRGNEIQHIVTTVPKVLIANKRKLTQIFDFVHNTMDVPHSLVAKFPQVLNAKFLRIRERHLFLEYLGRAQYQPSQPNYISLDRLVFLPDDVFCSEVALATLEDFERFQKTL
ncbi:transcription termination factor 3, mitochondrial-like isoform X2 [Sinocyclocheilus rhinocerous]|uniref:transcription termination factor 3, mitochondrial-like isoform X2 n=1 Tax=Sinocyclocheilus rhinocerous TaxID=307959 RepID=UPI0007B921E7|nr:PREDICTED: transcription termination factor 3, mitochondrial-like isoform X2 [Sinocyclocheilus rhinocerous]